MFYAFAYVSRLGGQLQTGQEGFYRKRYWVWILTIKRRSAGWRKGPGRTLLVDGDVRWGNCERSRWGCLDVQKTKWNPGYEPI